MTDALKEDVRGAIARGWCSRANEHKEFDADLAGAIFTEVWAEIAAAPQALAATPAVGGEVTFSTDPLRKQMNGLLELLFRIEAYVRGEVAREITLHHASEAVSMLQYMMPTLRALDAEIAAQPASPLRGSLPNPDTLAALLANQFPQTFTTFGNGKTPNALVANVVRYLTTLTPPEQPAAVPVGMKLIYVKRWRTLICVPEKYADEIRDALRDALPPATAPDKEPELPAARPMGQS